MSTMPVLFIGHGSPMNALATGSYHQALATAAENIPQPDVIVVVSAHYVTNKTLLTASGQPRTIYDFYGFPQELYSLTYPCPGSPQTANFITTLLPQASGDLHWGIDHAAWLVLRHMYPKATIPVVAMSLNNALTPAEHYQLAQKLKPLRKQRILVIGSGNLVHNLSLADFGHSDAAPYDWATAFDEKIKRLLLAKDHIQLAELTLTSPLAVPTTEHYLPLLYVLALQEETDKLDFIFEDIQNASVAMRSFILSTN
jgi:4,5-DOPA dioxygenase extradiol